ncbi:MAG: fimbria/pilus periplasmic chaperone [Alphaproteobacteria bacterium]|nr:fimbria/pilus periplasmic chaperone [Alphaproteobacteria bacterium]
MNNKILPWVICFFLGLTPIQAYAGNAGLLLSPTRIVLENGSRYVTVTVRNTGDATGRYRIEIVDAVMGENGGIKLLPEGQRDEFSAADLLSFSPGSMTLKPNESQVVRLLVKNKKKLSDGEYRSHMQVKMTESDLDQLGGAAAQGTSIAIKAKISTVIPVIVRRGQTAFAVTVDDAKLAIGGGDNKLAPELTVGMSFSGNRSVLGDIKVTHIAPDGKETQLAFMQGIAIYRGVAKRTQIVPLTVPDGVNVHSGQLRIAFMSQEKEGRHVLSEKIVTL